MKSSTPLIACAVVVFGYMTGNALCFAADAPSVPKPVNYVVATPGAAVPHTWVVAEGARLAKANQISVESIRRIARQKLAVKGTEPLGTDVEALTLQLLQQASEATEADLRNLQAEMKATAEKKKAMRESQQKMKEGKDALADASSADQLHLRQLMDRKTKLEQIISNMTKKASDTSASVTGNLK